MDWIVTAGDLFLAATLAALLLAPLVGAAGGWRTRHLAVVAVVFLSSTVALALTWRHVPGGVLAAASGHAALLVSALSLVCLGGALRVAFREELSAGLAGLLFAGAITIGPFASGPLMNDLPLNASAWLLASNPLVTIAAAAGIDLLHLDLIYRLSPLAHRGVALPAWTTVCTGYAVLGLAGYGVSRLRLRSA